MNRCDKTGGSGEPRSHRLRALLILPALFASGHAAADTNTVKARLERCGFDFENYRACWNREMKGSSPREKNANVCRKCAKLGVTVDDRWPFKWQVASGYHNACIGGEIPGAVAELEALVESCLEFAESPAESPEPDFQFFEPRGLGVSLCSSMAEKRAMELGFQPGRKAANAPKESMSFVNPAVYREQIAFRWEANEGGLELADLHMFFSNTLSREELAAETDRIRMLYGADACRESSVNVVCRGTRYVGPYQIGFRAQYDEDWIRYTFRNRFQESRIFEKSPVCSGSAAAGAGSSAKADESPGSGSGTEARDVPPASSVAPGAPSQPPGSAGQPASPDSGRPPASASPSAGQPGQKLFESAQALEEQAFARHSPELHASAADQYEKAAALGHPQATFNLSRKYARGEGVEQSLETELELLQRAAEAGLPQAQYNLALKYASGSGMAESPDTARELLEAAAEAGDADAQLALAKGKLAGPGSAEGDREAIELLEEAAAGGSAEAQYLLGRIFEDGVLAPRDEQQAEEYFCTAAAVGYEPAVAKCSRSFLAPNDTAKPGRQIRY